MKILIIEDDEDIAKLEKDYLQKSNFEVDIASDGEKGLEMALGEEYSLVLLDIMLPGMDGMQVCKELREKKDIPILFVTARKTDIDKVHGFGLGADDYIVKPFSPSELMARVFAHISRYNSLKAADKGKEKQEDVIERDRLRLEPAARRAYVNGTEVVLTNKEFDLLYFLASSPERLYSKEELLNTIWQYDAMGDASTVTVHVNRIRDKIKAADPTADYIHTVWGKGYRFN